MIGRLFLAAAVLAAAPPVFSEAATATFTAVKGEVKVWNRAKKKHFTAKAGDALPFGSEVRTLAGAGAHITLPKGGVLLVKEKSFFGVSGAGKSPFVSFYMGEFAAGVSSSSEKLQSLTVKTPAAVATLSGGADAALWGVSDAANKSQLLCLAGGAVVKSGEIDTNLSSGQKITVSYGEASGDSPVSMGQSADLSGFKLDGSLQGIDKLIQPK